MRVALCFATCELRCVLLHVSCAVCYYMWVALCFATCELICFATWELPLCFYSIKCFTLLHSRLAPSIVLYLQISSDCKELHPVWLTLEGHFRTFILLPYPTILVKHVFTCAPSCTFLFFHYRKCSSIQQGHELQQVHYTVLLVNSITSPLKLCVQ